MDLTSQDARKIIDLLNIKKPILENDKLFMLTDSMMKTLKNAGYDVDDLSQKNFVFHDAYIQSQPFSEEEKAAVEAGEYIVGDNMLIQEPCINKSELFILANQQLRQI